jgi:tetrahydromethanopterin S-methyltransferase subunit B
MAKRLTKLRVDEVSVVDKAANGKRFLILKRAAPEATPVPVEDSTDGGVRGWVKDAIKKAAGISGPENGGSEMTAEEIKKAVQEAAAEALAPIMERVDKLESAFEEEDQEGQDPVVKGDEPATELTEEAVTKLVSDAVTASIDPIVKRLETVEGAAGARRSATPEGAHQVLKADGTRSWEGAGIF